VVAGVGPVSLSGPPDDQVDLGQKKTPPLARLDLEDVRSEDPGPGGPLSLDPGPGGNASRRGSDEDVPVAREAPLAPDTPPVTQELGVESAAEPVGQPPVQTDPGSGSGAVADEFGP